MCHLFLSFASERYITWQNPWTRMPTDCTLSNKFKLNLWSDNVQTHSGENPYKIRRHGYGRMSKQCDFNVVRWTLLINLRRLQQIDSPKMSHFFRLTEMNFWNDWNEWLNRNSTNEHRKCIVWSHSSLLLTLNWNQCSVLLIIMTHDFWFWIDSWYLIRLRVVAVFFLRFRTQLVPKRSAVFSMVNFSARKVVNICLVERTLISYEILTLHWIVTQYNCSEYRISSCRAI